MKPRIIFCDFDGTLVGRDLVLSPRLKEAVKLWLEKGNLFSLASGRQFAGAYEDACRELGLTSPQVTMNGGQIVDPVKRTIIQAEYIDDADIQNILDILNESTLYHWVEKDFSVYSSDGVPRPQEFGNVPFKHISELEQTQISKAGVDTEGNDEDSFVEEKLVSKFPNAHIVRLVSLFGVNWDITAKGATKHTGVLKVISMLNLPRESMIGIGDGMNDFPLLEACKYKIAMGNGIDYLKTIADYVTSSYTEDGVAKAIYHLLEEDEKSE